MSEQEKELMGVFSRMSNGHTHDAPAPWHPSRTVPGINGLAMHVLEAGHETAKRPCVLLLHGFPELAYSWRKIMLPIAAAGFHVIAPDQRGYGRTTGWDGEYDGDVGSFRMISVARDALALVRALGYESVAAVIGHDFGSPVAAWCALVRPDVFRTVVLMSAPFAGPPQMPRANESAPARTIHDELAALPRPRKHYQWYYSTREANENMWHCPQGVHAFLRAYYHHKSADWQDNRPYPLASWTASELAKLPTYYIMNLAQGDGRDESREMPSASAIAACSGSRWNSSLQRRVCADRLRTASTGTAARQAPVHRGTAAFLGSHDRPARHSSPGKSDWGSISGRVISSACRRALARGWSPATWSRAPATGCSRSSRSK
jgi:pimeloyl-ACP methyl ester carboxylesterase